MEGLKKGKDPFLVIWHKLKCYIWFWHIKSNMQPLC